MEFETAKGISNPKLCAKMSQLICSKKVINSEIIDEEFHINFTSDHLAAALNRCYKGFELDNHITAEEKENSAFVPAKKSIKGIVPKCLEKDKHAFKQLENTQGQSKEHRISILSKCRPLGCRSAVDLLLWLVEKNIVKKSHLVTWEKEIGGSTAESIAKRIVNKFSKDPRNVDPEVLSAETASAATGENSEGSPAFNEFHFAKCLEACYSLADLESVTKKCLACDSSAFAALSRRGASSKFQTLLTLARCRPELCQSPADLLLWLVERKVVKKGDLEPWRGVFKGQTAKDIAGRIVARFRPDPDGNDGDRSDPSSQSDEVPEQLAESSIFCEKSLAFATSLLHVGSQDTGYDKQDVSKARDVLSALFRIQPRANRRSSGGQTARTFREGLDDEYEVMVHADHLGLEDWDQELIVEAIPDILRFHRGLPKAPMLSLHESGDGTVCCDLDDLRGVLRSELGAHLVPGPRDGCVFGLRLEAMGAAGDFRDADSSQDPLVCSDPDLILRILSSYSGHGGPSLPLFLDGPDLPAALPGDFGKTKAFECCICLKIMKDPASLGCGHSACLRCLERALRRKNECPLCRCPGPSCPGDSLRVTTALRDAIASMFPQTQGVEGHGHAESSREAIVDSFSDLEAVRSVRWFANFPCSLAERRGAVAATAARAVAESPGEGGDDDVAALRPGLERLLRRAGCLVEADDVYGKLIAALKAGIISWVGYLPGQHFPSDGNGPARGVVCDDVLAALARCRRGGRDTVVRVPLLYGFGGPRGSRFVFTEAIGRVLRQVHPNLRIGGGAASVISDMVCEILLALMSAAADSTDLMERAGESELATLAAGPPDEDGDLGGGHAVEMRMPRDGGRRDAKRGAGSGRMIPVITSVREAVAAVFPGGLCKHTLSDCDMAVVKFVASSPCGAGRPALAARAGLQVHPEHVALLLARAGSPVLDVHAAVLLAAVAEYLMAEVLELAGNAALANGRGSIDERCVALGFRGDEELDTLFRGHVRNGGEVPHIYRPFAEAARAPPSAFDLRFAALLRGEAAARLDGRVRFAVGVDPRDGRHYALKLADGEGGSDAGLETDTDEDEEDQGGASYDELVPVPQLDSCCALPASQRSAAARAALPPDALALLEAECGPAAPPDERARRALLGRLRAVRGEQRRTDPCLDAAAFGRLVSRAAAGLLTADGTEKDAAEAAAAVPLRWSWEALEALQAASEARLLRLCEAALQGVIRRGSGLLLRGVDVAQAVAAEWTLGA